MRKTFSNESKKNNLFSLSCVNHEIKLIFSVHTSIIPLIMPECHFRMHKITWQKNLLSVWDISKTVLWVFESWTWWKSDNQRLKVVNLVKKMIRQNRENVFEQNTAEHTETFYERDISMLKTFWDRETETNETEKLSNETECSLVTS
jgi:hypothetical protein